MTTLAGRREIQSDVIDWRLGAIVCRLVTRHARRSGQVVIIVDMALRARRCGMRSRQRKARRCVIKRRVHPVRRIVTAFARRRIAEGDVVHRSFRVVVIRLVARHTGCVRQLVVAVHVTQRASRGRVKARERPTGLGVIELAVHPQHSVVAAFARGRETESHVIHWRLRSVVSRLVAGHARRAGQFVVVIDMAQCALKRRMRSGQRKAHLRVVKRCAAPVDRTVATLTRCRQAQGNVVDRRLCIVVVGLVAGDAGRAG